MTMTPATISLDAMTVRNPTEINGNGVDAMSIPFFVSCARPPAHVVEVELVSPMTNGPIYRLVLPYRIVLPERSGNVTDFPAVGSRQKWVDLPLSPAIA
jgi:hypothetical protein